MDDGEPDELPSASESAKQHPVQQTFCRLLYTECHWKCFLLTVLLSGCLSAVAWCKLSLLHHHPPPLSSANFDPSIHPYRSQGGASGVYACEDSYIYIPVAFIAVIYVVYLVECWHCRVRHQLLGSVDPRTVYDHVRALREARPIVWWRSVCYHYVRRTRQVARYRNGDAFTSTQVYYERVNSHVGTRVFDFADCGVKDVSRRLGDLERFASARVRFTKRFSFATQEAEREFERQRAEFFSGCERRDDYMETREGVDFVNVSFRDQMVVFADPRHLPWYVSGVVFWVASVFLLSWPVRILVQYKTAYVHYYVHKVFGCDSMSGHRSAAVFQPPSLIAREDTMELEMRIRSNYVLVPSYSEALLMECPGSSDGVAGVVASTPAGNQIHPSDDDVGQTSRLVASSTVGRSYGTVWRNQQRSGLLRLSGGESIGVAEHAQRRGSAWETGGRDSEDRGGLSWARKWRRSYYEAVCFGASSSFTVDSDDERGRGSRTGRRSLFGRGGSNGRLMIAASASSPESFPEAGDGASYIFPTSVPHFSFGRPGSWSGGVQDRLQECDSFHLSSRSGKRLLAQSPSTREEENLEVTPSSTTGNPFVCSPVPSSHELPPPYEVALSMEQVLVDPISHGPDDVQAFPPSSGRDLGDDLSIETTSTYVSDSAQGTPKHQAQQKRMVVAFRSRRNSVDTFICPSIETTL